MTKNYLSDVSLSQDVEMYFVFLLCGFHMGIIKILSVSLWMFSVLRD